MCECVQLPVCGAVRARCVPPAKLSRSSRIRPNLQRSGDKRGAKYVCVCVPVCACVPDSVMEGQVLLPELRLGAQGQVDLEGAVLHPLGGQLALGFGQHGRQRDALCHGLLVVAAHHDNRPNR